MLWLVLVSTVFAAENWLCTTESSQARGNQVFSCGIGYGRDEDAARTKAFESAKSEFNRLCEISSNCRGRTVSVDPKRTTCDGENGKYKCYRLIVFTIGDEMSKPTQASANIAKKKYSSGEFWRTWEQKTFGGIMD